MEKELKSIAISFGLNPDQALQFLEESYNRGLLERTYNKPDQTLDVDAYRALFSKNGRGTEGLKPGVLGDKSFIQKKLKEWFKLHPQSSMEDVLNATKYYVDTVISEGKVKYLIQADYFISKNGRSQLSAAVDEWKAYSKSTEKVIFTDKEDWTQEIV